MRGDNEQAIRGTNDDAQISKMSCVRLGYFRDDYLHHFVKRVERRAPLINRGYYARSAALKHLILDFLQFESKGQKKQILSLGAGYDTTWFHLKARGQSLLSYFEVDFPEVIRRKLKILKNTPQLAALLSQELAASGGDKLVTSDYTLLPGDLREASQLLKDLKDCEFKAELPTLIIAECVLVYMPSTDSQALISSLGALLPTAAFIVYEQIKPDDAFGKQMMINLERRGCPLIGIHGSADLTGQKARFTNHNWQQAWAADMRTVYDRHIDPDDKRRIERLELFDEMEEWHLIQEHYCLAVGINDGQGIFHSFKLPTSPEATNAMPNAD